MWENSTYGHEIIRRGNRTYYSRVLKKQMNQKEISALIRGGEEVYIRDESGLDITTEILVRLALGTNLCSPRDSRNKEKMDFMVEVMARYISRDELENAICHGGFEEFFARAARGLLDELSEEVLSC